MRRLLPSVTVGPRPIRVCGVATVVACVLLVVGTVVETLTPTPDSFVFSPPVTHPQFVHSVVLPVVWLLAAVGLWLGLLALWVRDWRAYDTVRTVLAFASVLGGALVVLAYLGFAVGQLNELAGNVTRSTGLLSSLLWLAGAAFGVVGVCLYSITLAARGPRNRVGGALLGSVLLTAVGLSASTVGVVPLSVGFGVLGYSLVRRPHAPAHDHREAESDDFL
jgi:hypothetical protein